MNTTDIKTTIDNMRQQIMAISGLNDDYAWAWWEISNLMIRIIVFDAATVEYAITDGDKTLVLYNSHETFIRIVEYELKPAKRPSRGVSVRSLYQALTS